MNRKKDLADIEKALARMKTKGHENTDGYKNLLNKWLLISFGYEYKRVDVSEQVIGAFGSQCSLISRATMFKENCKH